ncbi:MAG: beta-ketoacyl-ACP synthase III [bacterium]
MRTRFAGVGGALPETVVSNAEVEAQLGLDPGWIEGRTGVRERRRLAPDEDLIDLAEQAARTALGSAGIAAAEIDAIVVATTSGPFLFPALACLLHERLGLHQQPAFDVAAACAGFPYALTNADRAIRSGDHRSVLVVGADALSRLCDPQDRVTVPLFGDGAGAVVLMAEEEGPRGILATRLRAQGDLQGILQAPSGVRTVAELALEGADPWMRMRGAEVFRAAVEHLVALSREVLAAADLEPADVDLLVPHQANLRIIRMVLSQLEMSEDKVALNLDRCGNTSAASIPLALEGALAEGRLHEGDLLLLNAVGGGITSGAVLVRW